MDPWPSSTPAVAGKDIFLVGYSSNLTSRTIKCVSSSYHDREGEWVKRTLDFTYILGPGRGQQMAVYVYVKWPNYSIDVEVRNTSALLSMTHAEPKYQIRYYNNDSLVLSHPIRKLWELETCSLWVTRRYIRNISFMANETFSNLCVNPVYVTHGDACRWF
ncbi:japanin-like-RA1 isoform X2 [Dermacentor variabilis]|uniref:japanin-like-RA1 isoform X2 n=1 Tax=Dermacentor variabilis TaxID=34621 RepID=UPI003F5C92A3